MDKMINCDKCGKSIREDDAHKNVGSEKLTVCAECKKDYDVSLQTVQQMTEIYFSLKNTNRAKMDGHNLVAEEIKSKLLTPDKLIKILDEKVKGQDAAKKTLAVAVYNHYLSVCGKDQVKQGIKLKKNNVIVTGPTGTGKTMIAEILAEVLNVPMYIGNATTLSETGYVGCDVESLLSGLIREANYDEERAKYGIIFLDEVDKIAKKAENPSITRDVNGEGVQKSLLKMMEGCTVTIPEQARSRVHPQMPMIPIDTSNILFICAGAFDGIEDIVSRRLQVSELGSSTIGFNNVSFDNEDNDEIKRMLRSEITHEDIENFGMIPEFVGRLPIRCNLEPLTVPQIEEILKSEYGILAEYKERLKLNNKELIFTEDSINVIAKASFKRGCGARGLMSIVSEIMEDILFNAPIEDKHEYIVDADYVKTRICKSDSFYVDTAVKVRTMLAGLKSEFRDREVKMRYNEKVIEGISRWIYCNLTEDDDISEIIEKVEKKYLNNTIYQANDDISLTDKEIIDNLISIYKKLA